MGDGLRGLSKKGHKKAKKQREKRQKAEAKARARQRAQEGKPEREPKSAKELLGIGAAAIPFVLLILATWGFYDWQSVLLWVNSPFFMEFSKELRAIVGVAAWLFLGKATTVVVEELFWDGIMWMRTGRQAPQLLRGVFAMLIYLIVGGAMITFVFERSPTFLFAATGGAGIVVGFAVQTLIADFFAGIVLTVQRPFTIGDVVEIDGNFGTVQDINWRVTTLLNAQDQLVSIPNNKVAGASVINSTHAGSMKLMETVEIDYDVPVARVMGVLRAALNAVHDIPGKAPNVEPVDMNENGVTYRIRFWAKDDADRWPAFEKNLASVQTHLQSAGIRYSRSVLLNPSSKLEYEKPNESARRRLILSKVPLFEGLDDESLELLSNSLAMKNYPPGENIVEQHASGDSMYLIATGITEVLVRFGAGEDPTKVAELAAGQVFGEISLLTGEPRSATVRSQTHVEAYEISKESMAQLFERRPELADQLAEIMAQRQIASEAAKEELSKEEALKRRKSTREELANKIRGFFGSSA